MTLIIPRKTITNVFDTLALQLIVAFQCNVTYAMKLASLFIDRCSAFNDFIVCNSTLES